MDVFRSTRQCNVLHGLKPDRIGEINWRSGDLGCVFHDRALWLLCAADGLFSVRTPRSNVDAKNSCERFVSFSHFLMNRGNPLVACAIGHGPLDAFPISKVTGVSFIGHLLRVTLETFWSSGKQEIEAAICCEMNWNYEVDNWRRKIVPRGPVGERRQRLRTISCFLERAI